VRHLLALDAQAVLARLDTKQDEMVALFSRHRSREPLLTVLRSHYTTITFPLLAVLEPHEQRAVHAFHQALDELRWYVHYTEDMPSTVRTTLALQARRLAELGRELFAVIGGPDAEGAPVVDGATVR
jgi:hypothetical protein